MRIQGKTAAAVAALSLAATPALIGIAAIVAGGVIIATDDDDPDSN